MALRKLLVILGSRKGELPAGDTIACLPLQPIPRAQLPASPTVGTLYMVSDAPALGVTLTWWTGTRWAYPGSLLTLSLT